MRRGWGVNLPQRNASFPESTRGHDSKREDGQGEEAPVPGRGEERAVTLETPGPRGGGGGAFGEARPSPQLPRSRFLRLQPGTQNKSPHPHTLLDLYPPVQTTGGPGSHHPTPSPAPNPAPVFPPTTQRDSLDPSFETRGS